MTKEKKFVVGDILRETEQIDPGICVEVLLGVEYVGLDGELCGLSLARVKEALAEKDAALGGMKTENMQLSKEIAKRQKYCEDARDMLIAMRDRLAKDLVLIQEGRRLLKEKEAEIGCLHQELSENYVNMEKEGEYLQKIKGLKEEMAKLKGGE